MSVERRLLACVLLLATAAALPLTLLPDHIDAVTLPIAVAAGAVVVTLLPSLRVLQTTAWACGALLVLVFVFLDLRPVSLGPLVLLPFGVLILTDRSVAAALAAGIGTFALVTMLGPEALLQARAFAWSSPADAIANTLVWGWAAWLATAPLDLHGTRLRLAQQHATAVALDAAMDRDRGWLETIAEAVADPTLVGPVRGAGLRSNALGVAVRIDSRRVLLGWIEGEPLAVLSAAWALAATARAGRANPRALVRFAREQLDEMLPENAINWLAIWDRRSGALESTLRNGPTSLRRCVLMPRGPAEIAKPEPCDTTAVVDQLLPRPGVLSLGTTGAAAPIAATVLALVAALCTSLPLPGVGMAAALGMLLLAHEVARRGALRRTVALEAMQAQLGERAELHDDLRFRIAKLHGGLLPYRLAVGQYEAIAHRLRGEVLDGSFADLVLDPRGVGHVVAGEVAGRGIAARFLGLTAQLMTRTHVEEGRASPEVVAALIGPQLRALGSSLQYPVRLRLGEVAIEPDGWCEGDGTLRRIVAVRGVSTAPRQVPLAPTELVRVTGDAQLDDDTRVYLTPAPSLPGPDDEAPAIDAIAAADRVVDLVQKRRWRSGHDSLPSLFSLVFDGVAAPSHGTLVELRAQQDGSGSENGERKREEQQPTSIAAV
jgi:hypothetical protein